jgi:hypothetical protein
LHVIETLIGMPPTPTPLGAHNDEQSGILCWVFLCWKKWAMGPQAALYFQQAKNELYILTALLKLLLAHMSCYYAQIPTIYFCTSRWVVTQF